MVYDRYRNDDFTRGYNRREDQDYSPDYGSGREFSYSSARNYAAAGMLGPRDDRNFRQGGTGYGGGYDRSYEQSGSYGSDYGDYDRGQGYGGYDRGQSYGGRRSWETPYRGSYTHEGRRFTEQGGRQQERDWRRNQPEGYNYEERGFMDRAGDEVRSWFGDEDAERRREMDQRYDERMGHGSRGQHWTSAHSDSDYHHWRRSQIEELDRDYDEYRRENASKFATEFGTWRANRQSQRSLLSRVNEHMEVVGSDGEHLGTVDCVRGDRIILTKSDPAAGGHHHSIPSKWLQSVDEKVTIAKSAEEAKRHWRDEERSGAFFGSNRDSESESEGSTNLNRSFSGTY